MTTRRDPSSPHTPEVLAFYKKKASGCGWPFSNEPAVMAERELGRCWRPL
jgi:hypothetical protein